MKLFQELAIPDNVALPLTRAVENRQISHAYLFHGNDENLLDKAAQAFAKAIVCTAENRPCESCSACIKTNAGSHPDLIHLYPDGASIKITQIRQLKYSVSLKPFESAYKVYIIHQADTMQKWAQNSLLKTLEESNKYVIIILLAVNKGAFYPTILSRCQVYAFSDVGLKNELIDSVYRVFLAAYEEDYERVFESIAAFHDNDFSDILSCISSFVRDFLACRLSGESTSIYNQAYSGFIQRAAKRYSVEMLHDTISFICDIRTGASANVKLMLQAIFLRF